MSAAQNSITPVMERYALLFWDFDGVIKESVAVKTEAFARLFAPFGSSVVARIRRHHECHGGMSRLDKIPLYLSWAGQPASAAETERYCARFAADVAQAVIDSAWVPGAREYLRRQCDRQRFVLISATPQEEMVRIVTTLHIDTLFLEVHGAPTAKSHAIAAALARYGCRRGDALVVGDSLSDYEAAAANGVEFLLRRTHLNTQLQRRHRGLQCEDFVAP
jgi:phosphoglycolate phosphatase-like HAD superfamily hydrolase